MGISSRLRQALTALGAGYLGLAAWNGWVYRRTRQLDFPLPLAGETGTYDWPGGRIFYTRHGQREPVLLVHGIYAGADSHEFRPIFRPLAERYRVYAYDLLGFGHSARPDVRYSGALYVRLLIDFVRQVIGRPVTVIANSMSGGHAIVAAAEAPDWIRRLILVAPTGVTRAVQGPGVAAQATYLALELLPDLAEGLKNAIATRASIRWFLRNMVYYDPHRLSEDRVELAYRSSHQPGAEHALIAFLTSRLDAPLADALRALRPPLALLWGREARVTPLSQAERLLAIRPDAGFYVFERTGLDVIGEQPQAFLQRTFDILAGREAPGAREPAAVATPAWRG